MKGLLIKDYLTIKKKYGITRLVMDIAIIVALMLVLEGAGSIYVSFLLIPIEVTSMIISLTTCDEQWKWGKYAISLPLSKKQIVQSRYLFAFIMSLTGLIVALVINTISYFCFPQYAYGFYLFIAFAAFGVTLLLLAFILPSNYSLGVNAGFAAMIVLVIVIIALGFWSKMTGDAIMWFVVDNFELCMAGSFIAVIVLCVFSYMTSIIFFNRKHA